MDDVKNLLTVTLVVMAAGSSIYTIKTYMKPGMDLNINLEESGQSEELVAGNETGPLTSKVSLYTGLPLLTTELPLNVENNTIALELPTESSTNKSINTDRKRSLTSKEAGFKIVASSGAKADLSTKLALPPIVSTALGKIEGIQMNVLGKPVYAYLGINYAQAPVDKLRFQKPAPIAPWSGKQSAKQFGKACLQVGSPNQSLTLDASENCLNLNIWTPFNGMSTLLPVLFFIHGGSFVQGSNSADETDGRVLASLQNIVVVNVNYRLGPFGFLHLSNDTGNLGLHDLVEAVRWTRNNIKYFGGNPDSITLVGHSSGALASALLLTSPETKHFFKRAILQSGSSTVFNFYYQQSQKSSEEFATMLGCLRATDRITLENEESVFNCIQNATTAELLRAAEKQLLRESYSYSPRIGDSFVPNLPKTLLDELRQESEKKDILIGTNANEAAFFFNMGYPQLFTKKTPSFKDLEEVRQFLSASLKDWGISRRTLRLINSFFLEKSTTVEPKTVLRSMYDIFGDLTFTCPTLYFAEKFGSRQNFSSYFYFYNYAPSNRSLLSNDELPYVFGYPLRFPQKFLGQDIDFSKKMMDIWATFVRTGKPPLVNNTNWPRFTADNQSYVELNGSDLRVIPRNTGTTSDAIANNSSLVPARFNCDTWKHAFKIFA